MGKLRMCEANGRFCIGQHIFNAFWGISGVDGNVRRTSFKHRQQRDHHLDRPLETNANDGFHTHALLLQKPRQLIGTAV